MKQPIRTEYKREHYYFNRTDPYPDTPFEDEQVYAEHSWLYKTVMYVAAMVIIGVIFEVWVY
jgi:hypothetical protein